MPLLPEKIRLAPKNEVEGLYDIPTELKGWADEVVHDLRFGQVSEWFDYPRLERAWENPESRSFLRSGKGLEVVVSVFTVEKFDLN